MGCSLICSKTKKKKFEQVSSNNNKLSKDQVPESKVESIIFKPEFNDEEVQTSIELNVFLFYVDEISHQTAYSLTHFFHDMSVKKLSNLVSKTVLMQNEDLVFYHEQKKLEIDQKISYYLQSFGDAKKKNFEIKLYCTSAEKKIIIFTFFETDTNKKVLKKLIVVLNDPIKHYLPVFKKFLDNNNKYDIAICLNDERLEINKRWSNYKIENFTRIDLDLLGDNETSLIFFININELFFFLKL